jgi:hypothetical protein
MPILPPASQSEDRPKMLTWKHGRIVESGINTALIMEDDMDWDIHLKAQLRAFAEGARSVLRESSHNPQSPYSDSWDLLRLGHCGEPFPENLEENVGLEDHEKEKIASKYLIINDSTVPPYEHVSNLIDWSAYPPKTRIVHRSAAPICSFAYAVSQTDA